MTDIFDEPAPDPFELLPAQYRRRELELPIVPATPPTLLKEGACRNVSKDLFIAADPNEVGWSEARRRNAAHLKTAQTICSGCDVSDECFEYAIANPKLQGWWAGTSEIERKRVPAARARTAALEQREHEEAREAIALMQW